MSNEGFSSPVPNKRLEYIKQMEQKPARVIVYRKSMLDLGNLYNEFGVVANYDECLHQIVLDSIEDARCYYYFGKVYRNEPLVSNIVNRLIGLISEHGVTGTSKNGIEYTWKIRRETLMALTCSLLFESGNKINRIKDYIDSMAETEHYKKYVSIAEEISLEASIEAATDKLERYMIDNFKVEDNELNRFASVCFWFNTLHRGKEPGCDQQVMIVLYSAVKGVGKSEAIVNLVPEHLREHFLAPIDMTMNQQDMIRSVAGSWVAVQDEFRENKFMKEFISRNRDKHRKLYSHDHPNRPRTFSLYASTNDKGNLFSDREKRRYLQIEYGLTAEDKLNPYLLTEENRQEMYSAALYLYNQGIRFPFTRELMNKAVARNESFVHSSALEDYIRNLDAELTEGIPDKLHYRTASEIITYIKDDTGIFVNPNTSQLRRIMEKFGYSTKNVKVFGTPVYLYYKEGLEGSYNDIITKTNREIVKGKPR